MNKVHYMSNKDDWETPDDLFNALNEEYGFTVDVCATAHNKKLERYWSEKDQPLIRAWTNEVCWMNPPYGRKVTGEWVMKAYYESTAHNALVVCLLPARTDTKWFHVYCTKGSQIHFIKGRLKFKGAKYSASFPSMIVVFGHKN